MNRVRVLLVGVFALALVFIAVFSAVRLLASEEELADDNGPGIKVLVQVLDDASVPVTITTGRHGGIPTNPTACSGHEEQLGGWWRYGAVARSPDHSNVSLLYRWYGLG